MEARRSGVNNNPRGQSVIPVTPTNGATGVLTNTTIKISFSKLMNPLTITGSTFTITSNGKTQDSFSETILLQI